MTERRPASRRTPADHCPRNDDCHRQMAEAQTRLADHFDHLFGPPGADPEEQGEAMKVLVTLGQIGGKWLQFCVFLRKRGPWLLASAPLIASVVGAVIPELGPLARAVATALVAPAGVPGVEG